MLVDDLTVSGLLRILREMQADKLTCDQINEISGEDLSTLVQNLSDISDKLSTIQSTIDQCETDASTFKTGIADAIKGVDSTASVTGDSSLPDFTSGIQNIVPNVTSDATATAGHILKDKTAYVNGNKVTGTIASKAAATYTPGTSNQTIAAGQYLSGAQTIAGDADLVAGNIKTGVDIFGVTGTFTSDATATAGHILKDKTAYVNGNKVTGTMNNYSGVETPRGATANITSVVKECNIDVGGYYGIVSFHPCFTGYIDANTVINQIVYGLNPNVIKAGQLIGAYGGSGDSAITGTFTSDANAAAGKILSGYTAYVNGSKVTGTMTDRSSNTGTNGLSWAGTCDVNGNPSGGENTFYAGNSSDQLIVPIPSGYYNGNYNNWGCCGLVVNYISSRLGITDKARTILSGNTILGVSGTLPNYSGVVTHINYSRIANGRVEFACEEGYHGCYWAGNSYEYMSYDEVLNLIGCSADKIMSGKYILDRYGTATSDANASAEYIAYGKTAYVNGSKITGKLTNYSGSYMLGNINIISTNTGGPSNIVRMSYSVPSSSSGFYVPSNSSFFLYADKSVLGDAVASSVLSGSTFTSSSGLKVAGTMNNYGGQTIAGDLTEADGSVVKFRVTTGGYCSGTTKISRPYSTVASALGITAAKIASGQTICGVTGTYTGAAYNCRTWSYTAEVGEGSSDAFTLLGGTKTLSSSSWVNSASSSNSSYYSGQIDDLSGKINSSTFAICRVTAPTYGIRRSNGYSSGSTTASYRYLKELVIFADEYLPSAGMDSVDWAGTHEYHLPSGTYIKRIRGYWLDSNRDNSSTATSSHQLVEFYITEKGYACVEFIASTTNVFAFRGPLKFEFWVFYK